MPREQSSQAPQEGLQEHSGNGDREQEERGTGSRCQVFLLIKAKTYSWSSPEAGSTGGSRPSRSPWGGVVGSGCEGWGVVHAWGVPCLRNCREGGGMILVVGTECVHSEKTGSRGGGARARLEGWEGGATAGLPSEAGLPLLRVSEKKCEVRRAPDTRGTNRSLRNPAIRTRPE